MKKIYFMALIATAAFAMTSCSNDDIAGTGTEISKNETAQAINFSTYLGRAPQSRVDETNETQTGDAFGVFASYTGASKFVASSTAENSSKPNFMFNQEVTSQKGENESYTWSYEPVKYWPNKDGEMISFFAYAPYVANGNSSNIKFAEVKDMKGTPTITVTIPEKLEETKDFVASAIVNQKKTETVTYKLLHELTKLNIKAKVSEDVYHQENSSSTTESKNKTFVVIKSIKLDAGNSIYTSGTYTFNSDNDASTATSSSTTPNNKGEWVPNTANPKDLNFAGLLNSTSQTTTNNKYTQTGIRLNGTTPVELFKTGKYAFLIPVGALAKDAATVTITYDIVTEDTKLEEGYVCTSASKTVSLPAGILKQGTAYELTFSIGVKEVKLDASVESWTKSEDENISVPDNGSDTKTAEATDNSNNE